MYQIIYSSVKGHLGCFHVLAIVNSATINIGIHVSFSILVSSGYISRSGIAGSYGSETTLLVLSETIASRKRYYKVLVDINYQIRSDQISRSVAQSCPTLCNPMNRSTPGLPVHHQLPEFTQTHVHPVSDAIQPSHPLSSPSPPAPNPSQYQSLFQ